MAITRGVLSRATEDRVVVNVQEVTNDESPPVINGAPSITLTPLEGAVHSTTAIATVEASDRLNFSFQKLSGPTEVTIDPNNGQIKTSKAVSRTASWNTPNSPGNSSTIKATDTAGNDSSLTTININPQYAGALASWATGESVSQSTNIISYDLSGSINDTTFPYIDEAFNESEFAGYFDQLNINNSLGSTTGQSGYGRVDCFVTDFSDDDAHSHIRTILSSSGGNIRLGLAQSGSFTKTWTSGDSLDVVFGLVPDNHYYYELITNPGSPDYAGQFGADELFRDAPDNCIRVRHSSDADDVTISTGQLVNIGAKRSVSFGISPTVTFPTGLINQQAIGGTASSQGACYYAINNGDGTLSFATSRSNAIAETPVKVQFSTSGWAGTYTDTSRTSIRIRPTALRKHTYTVSDPLEVTHTPTLANYTPTSWSSLSGVMTIYYYVPTVAANAFTDVMVANISGGVGSHLTSTPYSSFGGVQIDTSTPSVFKLRLPQNTVAAGTYVLSVSDQAGGSRAVSYSVQPVSEIVLTSGNVSITTGYSSGVVAQATCSGGLGAYTFAVVSGSTDSTLLSNGLAINSSTGEISLLAGVTGSHTLTFSVTDTLGNSEDFSIPFVIASPVTQTITIAGVGSPTNGVNYYGYSGGLYGGSGTISPQVAPFASFVSGNVTMGVYWQSAFGSYVFYVNIHNNGASGGIPANTFTNLHIDDGVNTRDYNTGSVYHSYSANIGSSPNKYSQWRWTFSPGDAQYQRVVNMNSGDTIALTFT